MEIEILEPVYELIKLLENDKNERELFIMKEHTLESKCYCKNGFKYKDCHGLELRKVYQGMMEKVNDIIKASC